MAEPNPKDEMVTVCLSICLSVVQSRKYYLKDFNEILHKNGLFIWD